MLEIAVGDCPFEQELGPGRDLVPRLWSEDCFQRLPEDQRGENPLVDSLWQRGDGGDRQRGRTS